MRQERPAAVCHVRRQRIRLGFHTASPKVTLPGWPAARGAGPSHDKDESETAASVPIFTAEGTALDRAASLLQFADEGPGGKGGPGKCLPGTQLIRGRGPCLLRELLF